MAFVRGGNVKETLNIGRDAILKEIGGIVLNTPNVWKTYEERGIDITAAEEDSDSKYNFKKKNVIIGTGGGKYVFLKNKITYDGPDEGEEKDLIYVLLKLQESFRKNRIPARTIGLDLVAVKPMSAPIGTLTYLDYQHSGKPSKIIGNGPI